MSAFVKRWYIFIRFYMHRNTRVERFFASLATDPHLDFVLCDVSKSTFVFIVPKMCGPSVPPLLVLDGDGFEFNFCHKEK